MKERGMTTVLVSETLHARLKQLAREEGRLLQYIVDEALRKFVDSKEKKAKSA